MTNKKLEFIMSLEFVTNCVNPYKGPTLLMDYQELEMWRHFASKFTQGPPKGTEKYSSKELKAMGYVGFYRKVEENHQNN
jgi:hypothetical protein